MKRAARPRARTAYAAVLLAAALAALLVAWFLSGWADVSAQQRAVREAPEVAARARSAELARELRGELAELMRREADRKWNDYQNLIFDTLTDNFRVSPLRDGPNDPLVLGYFQVDANGGVTTPTINDDLPMLSEPTNLAGNTTFRNEVVRTLAPALAPAKPAAAVVAQIDRKPADRAPAHPPAPRPQPRPPPVVIAQATAPPANPRLGEPAAQLPVPPAPDPTTVVAVPSASYEQNANANQIYQQQRSDIQQRRVVKPRGSLPSQAMSQRMDPPASSRGGSVNRANPPAQAQQAPNPPSQQAPNPPMRQQAPAQAADPPSNRVNAPPTQAANPPTQTEPPPAQAASPPANAAPPPAQAANAAEPPPVEQPPKPPPARPKPPPRAPAEPKQLPPVLIQVSAFEWKTLPFRGEPSLVAVRSLQTPAGPLAQGFVVDRATLTSWLATHAGDAVAVLEPGDLGAAAELAPGWHVSVSANPRALGEAAADASQVATAFLMRFVVVGVIAVLAAMFVVMLVARAERLARERSQFAAAAAHELRTPLAGLQLYGDMLADGLGDPAKLRDYARRMSEEASRLGRVVSNVLGFSQLERGNLSVEAKPGPLGDALAELAERAQPALDRAGAALELDVPPELTARFDRDALARIVGNLLDNAEKYSRGAADRTIALAARELDDAVEVVVADHGPGVAQASRASLFHAFKRGVDADGPAGLGLGLALSQSLARAMGGDLAYRPSPTGGAAFALRLAKA